jgi:hypothetical protein
MDNDLRLIKGVEKYLPEARFQLNQAAKISLF